MRILSLVDVSHARRDVTEHPFSRALGDQTYQPSERADRRISHADSGPAATTRDVSGAGGRLGCGTHADRCD